MAALQRFKLLATQCGVAQSPTRSPRTSPVVILRRRKTTLRMLLSGRRSPGLPRRDPFPPPLPPPSPAPRKRDTLKDLFVSSPTPSFGEEAEGENEKEKGFGGKCEVYRMKLNRQSEPGGSSPRPGWVGFRHRLLLRRAWRPMLAGIPESD